MRREKNRVGEELEAKFREKCMKLDEELDKDFVPLGIAGAVTHSVSLDAHERPLLAHSSDKGGSIPNYYEERRMSDWDRRLPCRSVVPASTDVHPRHPLVQIHQVPNGTINQSMPILEDSPVAEIRDNYQGYSQGHPEFPLIDSRSPTEMPASPGEDAPLAPRDTYHHQAYAPFR